MSAVSLFDSVKAVARILHSSFSEGAVAHAACGTQCRDDGGDDAADDLEDDLPRFLVVLHGVRWFLRVINFGERGGVSRREEFFFEEGGVWSVE